MSEQFLSRGACPRGRRLRVIAGAVFLLGVFVAAASAAETRLFSADDRPKIVRIGDPQISPDGKTVAIVVSRANLTDNR